MKRPLSLVAAGLLLVAFDFRTDLPDLFPDPLGWGLVAWGMWMLRLHIAAGLAGVAAVLSVSEVALPYRYVCLNPRTYEPTESYPGCTEYQRWDTVSDLRALALGGALLAGGAAIWRLLTALADRAEDQGRQAIARRLRIVQFAVAAGWTVPTLLVVGDSLLGDERYDPVWNGDGLEMLATAGFAVLAWLVFELVRHRDRAFAVVTWRRPPATHR